mgnify:FL=1
MALWFPPGLQVKCKMQLTHIKGSNELFHEWRYLQCGETSLCRRYWTKILTSRLAHCRWGTDSWRPPLELGPPGWILPALWLALDVYGLVCKQSQKLRHSLSQCRLQQLDVGGATYGFLLRRWYTSTRMHVSIPPSSSAPATATDIHKGSRFPRKSECHWILFYADWYMFVMRKVCECKMFAKVS